MSNHPRPLPDNFLAQAFVGLAYPLWGLGFIRRHRLWPLTFAAIGINVVLLGVLVGLSVWLAMPYLAHMQAAMTGIAESSAFLQEALSVVGWIIWVLALALLLAANGLVLMLVGQAVASPFLDMISERVEAIVLGEKVTPFNLKRLFAAVMMALADLVWGLVFLAVVNLPIFLVGLVPVVGTVPAAVASFCFSALLLAQEFVGLPLTRQLWGYRARWRVVWRNKWLAVGFGSSCMGLLLVPGLNLVLLPLAAVGGTLLFCDLEAAGRVKTGSPSMGVAVSSAADA